MDVKILTKIIKFKDEYYDLIVNRSKTQTMRMPVNRINVVPGEHVVGVFPGHNDLLLRITRQGYKSFKSINDDDAKREGFENAEELKNVLKSIYKDYKLLDSNRFYYYQFEFIEVLK